MLMIYSEGLQILQKNIFESAIKTGKNKTNYIFAHQTKYLYTKTKFTVPNLTFLGLLFSRDAGKTHTGQSILSKKKKLTNLEK